MGFYEIEEACGSLDRLVDDALRGDEIVLTRQGRPLVALVPVGEARRERRLGTAAREVRITPDFDAQMPDFTKYQ